MFIGRRSFIEKLGLTAGAAVLSPIAQALVSEAHGQAVTRKRLVVFVCGGGISPTMNFTPPELRANINDALLDGPRSYTWPAMMKALEPWRSRMLLVDGLANQERRSGNGHSMAYSALSCKRAGTGGTANNEVPGGITIDQFIANKIGATTARKSVLVGVSNTGTALAQKVFAADYAKPERFFQDPRQLYQDLFGDVAADAAAGAARRRALLDSLRHDIARLRTAFAGPEREKLDGYLTQLEEVEKRQSAATAAGCRPETPLSSTGLKIEDRLSQLTDIATAALTCGMTNVVGVSVCTGNPHTTFPTWNQITAGTTVPPFNGNIGHAAPAEQKPALDLFHNFNASLIARMATALEAIKEGNGTALDNTVMVYVSDNAEHHHANHLRWPFYVLGSAGGKLRADGRFLRYAKKGTAGWRSMADFFCTLATACGVPTDTFGKGGNEPVTGPLGELLT